MLNWNKIHVTYIIDKRLITLIYKELLKIMGEKKLTVKWAKEVNRKFRKIYRCIYIHTMYSNVCIQMTLVH